MAQGTKGMLPLDELRQQLSVGDLDTVSAAFPDLYDRLVGKRIDVDFFLEQTAATGMHACDYLLTVDMEMDVVDGYDFTNWEHGYDDFHCQPDIGTLRRIDWLDRTALLFCDLNTEGGSGHERVSIGPRTMLARQLARLCEWGLVAKCGS